MNHFIEGVVFPQTLERAADYRYDYEQDYRSAVLQAWQSGEITAQRAKGELRDVAMPVPGIHIQTVNMSYNGSGVLTAKDRHVLSKLIVVQMLRVPSSVEYVQGELYKRVSREVQADTIRALSCLPAPLFEKCEEQVLNAELSPLELKEYYLDRSFSPERFDTYCDILNHRIYVVFYNTRWKIMPFITSDNPVIVEGIGNEKAGLFQNGMASPSTCIYFPINPAILIASYSRDSIIASTLESFDNQLMVIDDLKYVYHVNMMEIAEAYQHAFIPQFLYDEIVGKIQDCTPK